MKHVLILCNYNEGRTGSLEKALSAIQRNKTENTIIGIIDNGSHDNSYEIINKFQQNKTIDYAIFNTINVGKAKALNTLLKYIFTVYNTNELIDSLIYSIDSDLELLQDNFIIEMEKLYKTGKDITAVGINFITNGKFVQRCVQHNNNIISINNLDYYNILQYETENSIQGLAGGILVIPIKKFVSVGFYNENLGNNQQSAIYGGDDAVLLLKLLKTYPNSLFLCTKTLTANHPETLNKEYAEWKKNQNENMCYNGFGNNTLAISGFFD